MQIVPISNINFSASFKRTKELDTLLKSSDHETLYKFNKVLKRANKVNDGKVFKISGLINTKLESWGKISTFYFHLLSHPENNEYRTTMENVNAFEYNHNSAKRVLIDYYSNTMKNFVSTLEKEYPQTNFDNTRNELIKEIEEQLI